MSGILGSLDLDFPTWVKKPVIRKEGKVWTKKPLSKRINQWAKKQKVLPWNVPVGGIPGKKAGYKLVEIAKALNDLERQGQEIDQDIAMEFSADFTLPEREPNVFSENTIGEYTYQKSKSSMTRNTGSGAESLKRSLMI